MSEKEIFKQIYKTNIPTIKYFCINYITNEKHRMSSKSTFLSSQIIDSNFNKRHYCPENSIKFIMTLFLILILIQFYLKK